MRSSSARPQSASLPLANSHAYVRGPQSPGEGRSTGNGQIRERFLVFLVLGLIRNATHRIQDAHNCSSLSRCDDLTRPNKVAPLRPSCHVMWPAHSRQSLASQTSPELTATPGLLHSKVTHHRTAAFPWRFHRCRVCDLVTRVRPRWKADTASF